MRRRRPNSGRDEPTGNPSNDNESMTRFPRRRLLGVAVAGLAVVAGGCAGHHTGASGGGGSEADSARVPAHGPEVVARALPPYGTVLTTATGYALYVFEPDGAKRVTCTGDCAEDWPPLRPHGPASAIAGAGVRSSLLGVDADGSGGKVVTYAGWPLYTYISDSGPGYPSGQAVDSDGGLWFLITADGKVVKTGG